MTQPPAGEEAAALTERLGRLHTALLCDVLDAMGQPATFLGPHVRPLCGPPHVVGRVATMRIEAVEAPVVPAYRQLLQGLADLQPGDVVVAAGAEPSPAGLWGELLSTAAQARGAVGAVMQALCRDVEEIDTLGFPVFATGASPLDSAGRVEVVETGGELVLAGGVVSPGDYVVGDRMGVVTIAREAVPEAVRRAEEKARGETTVRSELAAGEDPREVFARHGIL
ncbi:RraA family protein [Ornithinicoccus halotolerans]|uniref:RraA family protein n=1 Tax=Ornithinicoccus halotolerans TaxID=1748220 RepID=UPI0012981C67|nr:RraA family protein [Ornithinicoccus halotolerans]